MVIEEVVDGAVKAVLGCVGDETPKLALEVHRPSASQQPQASLI